MLTLPQELRVPLFILGLICVFIAGLVGQAIYQNVVYLLARPQPKQTAPPPQPFIVWWTVILFLVIGGFFEYQASLVPATGRIDDSSFVYDAVTQDDDQFSPGQTFLKAWQLYNKGDTDWKNYEARRIDGTSVGPTGFIVPDTLAKHDAILSQEMTAPQTPGCYRSKYQMYNGSGFFGEKFTVQIVVVSKHLQDYVLFDDDLNIRDGTLFAPGMKFIKGWRLHNCGTNTWENYKAKRVSGNLAGPLFIPVPETLAHQNVNLWAEMTAPLTLTRESTAVYQLENAAGQPIPNGLFDVSIKTETLVT